VGVDFWSQFWVTVLALLVVGAVTFAASRLVRPLGVRALDRRAAFTLEPKGGQMATLTRVGGSTAFAVGQGDGVTSMSAGSLGPMMPGVPVGDLRRGQQVTLNLPNKSGCWVWLQWIERGGRAYCKSVFVTPTSGKVTLRAIRPGANEVIQT